MTTRLILSKAYVLVFSLIALLFALSGHAHDLNDYEDEYNEVEHHHPQNHSNRWSNPYEHSHSNTTQYSPQSYTPSEGHNFNISIDGVSLAYTTLDLQADLKISNHITIGAQGILGSPEFENTQYDIMGILGRIDFYSASALNRSSLYLSLASGYVQNISTDLYTGKEIVSEGIPLQTKIGVLVAGRNTGINLRAGLGYNFAVDLKERADSKKQVDLQNLGLSYEMKIGWAF